MDSVSNTLSILLLYVLWKINLVYDRYFGKNESISKALPPRIPVTSELEEANTEETDVLNTISESTTPFHQYELLTPIEEEMLKCSCAKGYTSENTFSEKLRDYEDENHIPRSMFTAMWIDSCVK
ncbi:hypothetical protein Trydic_g16865 [Trypoxylus dichotomus]